MLAEIHLRWYLVGVNKYIDFEGRAHRTEFWMFSLLAFVIATLLGIFDWFVGSQAADATSIFDDGFFKSLHGLFVMIPSFAVGARRLHDTGRSGWWQLLVFTIVGIPILVYWWVVAGDAGTNAYGRDPWASKSAT